MPSVFERRRYQVEHERGLLLETVLLLQSDASARMPAEDWLKLASAAASMLYARGPLSGQEGTGANAQQLVSNSLIH